MSRDEAPKKLFCGDNLDILRRYIRDESVDLVYLDPPFNSARNFNVLFAEQDGSRAAAQIKSLRGYVALGLLRIQLLTVGELLDGRRIDYPQTQGINRTF